ncbi:MAG: hypothetical protein J5533_08095 [Bacteroidales bacterium]|nr:hypothetical protein [Bacteroidales bacterium]
MKRFLLICAFALAALSAAAQDYEPTSTWPYLYPDFTEGEILALDGTSKKAMLNVHVLKAALHYIDGELIKELAPGQAFSARIGQDYYINASGKMMKVLAQNNNGYVAEGVEVDIVKLNSTGAAYGSSSTTLGTMALSSIEGLGASNSSTSINHMELKANKDNGQTLPLLTKKYLFVNKMCIFATKRDVATFVDAAAFKAFLKSNKVKWNDPQSLLGVVDFIAENN